MENKVNAVVSGTVKKIIVNGKNHDWFKDNLSYTEMALLAYPEMGIDIAREINYSSAYEYPSNIDKRGKIFHKGESVRVESGMIFNIYNISNA